MTKQVASFGSAVGKTGGIALGAAVERAKTAVGSVDTAAGPLLEHRLGQVKALAEPLADAVVERAKAQTRKLGQAAAPLAERAFERAKAYLAKQRP